MPTVARSTGYCRASATHCRLDAAVVPTAMTRSTPAARARSRTAGRSAAKRSSSRWAWVSIRATASPRLGGRCILDDGGVELQDVVELHFQVLADQRAGRLVRDQR